MTNKPLFMWAGGKTKLIKRHYEPAVFDKIERIKNYCEPFFGGGACYLYVQERYKLHEKITDKPNAIINDINHDVMKIYMAIRDDRKPFEEELRFFEKEYLALSQKEDRKRYYYNLRHEYANLSNVPYVKEAVMLYFLMKTGFNGIFQINKNTNGRFGTPCGLLNQTTKVYDPEVVLRWHKIMQNNTEITSTDWLEAARKLPDEEESFLFLDPPYRGSFTTYGQSFGDEEQLKILQYLSTLKKTKWLFCNRDTGDGFWENNKKIPDSMKQYKINKINITYTAGRRKKTTEGKFEAKKATEIFITNVK